jgi:integrase/recombinase XerD
MTTASPPPFPLLVQQYFCQRLIAQRNASQRTVSSYRDTFRLLLGFAENRLHKIPTALALTDLDAPFVLEFLDHLEHDRGNTPRTRNARLTTIRSFMKYASHQDPTALPVIQRVLAIPSKRFDRPMVGFLSREEIDAVLAAPDRSTWSGQRDHVLFATMYNTGARVSEVIAMRRMDLALDRSPAVRLHGKGRKERVVPLWQATADALRTWLTRLPDQTHQPVFPNARGARMSRSGAEDRLDAAVRAAAKGCPSLRGRDVSPHMLRHSTAMHLLQSGVDITVIALWLGHESPATTHLYVEADLQMKERALAMVPPANVKTGRYRPDDRLLAFLQAL